MNSFELLKLAEGIQRSLADVSTMKDGRLPSRVFSPLYRAEEALKSALSELDPHIGAACRREARGEEGSC